MEHSSRLLLHHYYNYCTVVLLKQSGLMCVRFCRGYLYLLGFEIEQINKEETEDSTTKEILD